MFSTIDSVLFIYFCHKFSCAYVYTEKFIILFLHFYFYLLSLFSTIFFCSNFVY